MFDLLVQYIKAGRIKLNRTRFHGPATYHDPCNYGRKAQRRFGHGFFEEPRWILDQCMENLVDLYPSRIDQFCCGGGGGALLTGYDQERIFYARQKTDQIKASGCRIVATELPGTPEIVGTSDIDFINLAPTPRLRFSDQPFRIRPPLGGDKPRHYNRCFTGQAGVGFIAARE